MNISDFSKKHNITKDTLRYYEKEGLLSPKRDLNNQRIYQEQDNQWIIFIIKLKNTGMSIKKIKEYSDLRKLEFKTLKQRSNILKQHLDFLNVEKIKIDIFIKELENKIDYYTKCIHEK